MVSSTLPKEEADLMVNVRKSLAILGVKGLLSLLLLTTCALALVSYMASVTVTPTQQFTEGATSATWTVYINDEDQVRYLPGSGSPSGSQEPTIDAGDSGTYAFKVVTDADKVCAIKIELTAAVNNSKFSKFEITLERWNSTGSAWEPENLYDAATGSTTISYIDGLTGGAAGYVHQSASATEYYLVKVTYSYNLVDETTQVTATFQYTPLPQDSF